MSDDDYVYDEASGEWISAAEAKSKSDNDHVIEVRDAVGNLLADGDQVTLIKDGDLTGFGLVNAVTGYAQEVDLYDRSTELEAIGGRLLDQGAKEWSELAEAA